MILFKDILTFLGLDIRDASLKTLYLVLIESIFQKSDESDDFNIQKLVVKKSKKSACFEWTYRLSGNDYRVDTLYKLYLTVTGINIQCLKPIGQFKHSTKAYRKREGYLTS